MNFKVKRILTIILSVLPVLYLVACFFLKDMILANDLTLEIFVVAIVLIVVSLVAIFALGRCPKCHLPITPTQLLTHSKKCPYCDKPYEGEDVEEGTEEKEEVQ